ncbi:MAG: LD-carboxypeptidase [Patescibacteria group bacterium]|nr:LD-carboxypeptidase [Patescibacteria group bacterium]
MYPDKLKKGDTVMVVAPSDSLSMISADVRRLANERFAEMGLRLSFAKHVEEVDGFDSSSVASRVADLHQAFSDKNVRGIFPAFGGFNSNQLLRQLDWDLIRNNPKIFVGYSDSTALENAIFAKTGLVTYSGPNYSRFGQKLYLEYTLEYFRKCLFENTEFSVSPSPTWSDDWWIKDQDKRALSKNDGWSPINSGRAKGTVLGGNLSTFNLLQGTEFFPDLSGSILFLEDDDESKASHFDRDLQSLIHLPDFHKIRGMVIGRFEKASKTTIEDLRKIIGSKTELNHIPILTGVDFGHTDPMITFPIGGEAELVVSREGSRLVVIRH